MATVNPESPTPPADDIPWNLLAAYIAGDANAETVRTVESWAAATPQAASLLAEVRQVWAAAQAEVPVPNVESMLARLRRAAGDELSAERRVLFEVVPRRTVSVGRRALLAASVAGLVLGGWWLAGRRDSNRTTPAIATAMATRAYTTNAGQRMQFTLPDGSNILLGPESELAIASDYGATSRVVTLRGEAYFIVTHDVLHPFEVRTQYAVIRDLGTAFVVRARPTEPKVRVAVAKGEVALDAGGRREVVLHASDLGEVRATGEVTRRVGVDLSPALAWTEGRLVFEATRLDELIPELERWYGIEIQMTDARLGATRTFTGTFGDETITDVLKVVCASLGLTLERDGQRFVLRAP